MTYQLPIAHLSINSKYATRSEIVKQEEVHWFAGLRQAELTIRDKEMALAEQAFAKRKQERKLRKIERDLEQVRNKLARLNAGSHKYLDTLDKIEDLEDQLKLAQFQSERMAPLERDAISELNVAKQERDRILTEHPEALTMPYDHLQDMGRDVLNTVLAKYVASSVWAAKNGLPDAVGKALFDIPKDDLLDVMGRVAVMEGAIQDKNKIAQAIILLEQLPPAQLDQLLIDAAEIVDKKILEEGISNDV